MAPPSPVEGQDVTYVFVAGIGNSGPDHWQRLWLDRVPAGVWVDHADWLDPDRDTWTSDLQKTVWRIRGPVVFVAHSLGCLVVAEWANERSDPSVAGAFLVAVPDPSGPAFPKTATGFGDLTAAALAFPSVVIASRDDPYGSIDHAASVAETWGSEFVDAGAIGHINAASGVGFWDEGWQKLQTFVAGLPEREASPPA
jgi:predicted alpha/beta hydrolase family esterase